MIPRNISCLLVLFYITTHVCRAQSDSTQFRLSALQLEIGTPVFMPFQELSEAEFRAFAPPNTRLDMDLSGYHSNSVGYYSARFFAGVAGGLLYFKLPGSRITRECFAGFRYSETMIASINFNRSENDTLGTLSTSHPTEMRYVLRVNEIMHNFSVTGHQIFVPLGLRITSSQKRFFWFSAGLEITPFFGFNHRFISYDYFRSYEVIVRPGEEPYFFGTNVSSSYSRKVVPLKIFSGGVFFGVPLTINLHPFRKETNFLGRLHASGQITPLFFVSGSSITAPRTGLRMTATAGLRIDLGKI